LGTLFTHELDAMTHHEWRILPLTSWLPDDIGMLVFLLFHIPLFATVTALIASENKTISRRSKIGFSMFLVIHGVLHSVFMSNTAYEFLSASSTILIFGGAGLGIIHLLLEFWEKRATEI
jgi:hypothetical protein